MENHQNFSKSDLNSIVKSYHSNHDKNRPECTIKTPSDYGLEKTKLTDVAQSEVDYDLSTHGTSPTVLIVDDDAVNDLKKSTSSDVKPSTNNTAACAIKVQSDANVTKDETSTKKVAEEKESVQSASAPTTTPVVDANTDNPEHKVIEMKHEDVNAKASTFIDHNNDNKNVSPAHKQNEGKASGKNTPTFVPDANGIIHTTVQAVNDLSAESIYGHDRKIYITAKFAKKMGLGAPNVKALDVNGIMIPIERLTKQELRHIKHEDAEQTRKTKREKRIAKRNGDDDLI